ncbi:MAG: DUF4082 domain-containing protein [Planctomycetia bacterium]|nr:DUF4082 domain-containing protein [Planctomycetia bacterium]
MDLEILESREVFTVNPIVTENMLPGNPQAEWDVLGAGDATIQGFTTDISYDQGQTVSFKVNDVDNAPYHIDIYRLGYYGGLGARKVATIASSQTIKKVQPSPLTNTATGLVDAGNWTVTATWTVPTNAVSGVYIGKLVREDTGGASHVIFIVRDDDGASDLLFQTSDTTWQAYNNWGGKSVYDYNSTDAFRAYKVSYNRPLTTRGTGSMSEHPFWAEVPMIRWLESNGYNVSYTSAVDTDRRGAELLEHQIFLSVGHDEYWSAGQRTNVENALAAGVDLGFFTGNTMYWKIRWEDSIDASGTAYRTMVTYKESTVRTQALPTIPEGVSQPAYVSGVEDPSSTWTGLWRDVRPGNDAKVEQELLGQIWSVNRGYGGMFGTAIQVPAEFAQMRLWRNTSVATLQSGQVATLANGTLGYEWDEDVDNGYRPAGTFNMSSTTEAVPEKLVDPISWPGCGGLPSALCSACRGCFVAVGTATHSLSQYRSASGALVFNTGTVQWSWGLDGIHDGGLTTPDIRMQQATVNIFADMGVQAGSLRPDLVQTTMSTDLIRPTSTVTAPEEGATFQVGVATTITGTASDAGGGIVAGVEVSMDGGNTWRKATGRTSWSYIWTPDKTGPATIISRVVDDSGNIEIPTTGVTVNVGLASTSSSGLVAAYNFNAGSGSSLDDSTSNNNDGTISGATWTSSGKYSGALSFDGTNDWVTISDANSLDLTNGMTLEAWVRPTSANNYGTALFKEKSGGLTYALYGVNGSSEPPASYINSSTDGEKMAEGASQLALNTWSHLAATYDGATFSLYVNGTLVSSQSVTGSLQTSNGVLRIGGNSVYGDYFQGQIDDVRVYNRALSHSEILADLSTPIGGSVETTAPTVSVTNSSGTVSGTVTLTATASDNAVVAGVQFLVNGQPVGTEDTSSPYSYAWNTLLVPNDTYTITARARDAVGNITTSTGVSLTVNNSTDTTAPTVLLTGLTPNSTVGGSLILSAIAADNVGVVGVQFKANGTNIGSEVTNSPYSTVWNTAGLSAGTYSITAVARDGAGNTTTSTAISVTVDSEAPSVTNQTPVANATGIPTNIAPTITFSESIQLGYLSFVLTDAGGNPHAATISYDDAAKTASLHPLATLEPSTTYTLTVSGVRDLVGNVMSSSTTWSFTTATQLTGATIWNDVATPSTPAANDPSPIEVGVKFRSELSGYITGLRFYKGLGNTGTHIGHLWSSSGALLGTATFTNETGTGWQTVSFSNPVSINANTTYIASYYAPNGHYAVDSGYFATSGVSSSPLRALADGEDGGNGLYLYNPGGGFPTQTFNAGNYWVDVVFTTTSQDNTAPTVTAQNPVSGSIDIPIGTVVTVTFSESIQANTLIFVLKDSSNNTVASTVSYNDATQTATLTPTNPLAHDATYTATVSGAKDAAGNTMTGSVSWSFATAAQVSGATSIWTGSVTPATTSANDPDPIEVGVKFRSTSAGYISGLRFYKGAANTGAHIGHLWSSTGTLLATATFTNETATGWQQVNFSTPVAISANTTYIASYYAPNGGYAVNTGYFATSGVTNGVLEALANGVDGGNGLYKYASGGGFPNSSFNSSNYWVDVVYTSTYEDVSAPSIVAQTPASDATGVSVNTTVTVTFSESIQSNSLSLVLTDAANNTVAATVSYNDSTRTATLTPTSALALNTTYTATVSASDTAGNQMSATSWAFTTPTPVTNATLWPSSATPQTATSSDTSAIEVGVRFFSEVGGYISGLRFYKGAGNTGTHVGHLWSNTGSLMATATFTNETDSGWQQVNFSSPVAIQANTLYVASYYAPNGGYSVTSGGFATEGVVNGYLHAPPNGANAGNGLFLYGSSGGFPTGTYNANNYWVDVVFTQSSSDVTAPTILARTPVDGSTGVLPTALIQVTFSEVINPSTVNFLVKDSFDNIVAGNLNYDPETHIATFIPTSQLLSFMTYTVTVSGVTDLSGNVMTSASTWTFKTRGIWIQTSASDFSTGTNDGTVVTNTNGGEVTLAPLLQDSFTGSTLSGTNWTTSSWSSAGGGPVTTSITDGVLSVGGTGVFSAPSYANTAVEGSIKFGGVAYQHFGLATNLDAFAGNYWAIFSTMGTTNTLYARVNANGTTNDVNLGSLPSGFHTYKVKPVSSGFEFYIDDTLQTTISASFQSSVPMKAVLSDFLGNSGGLLQADWVGFLNYSTTQTGTFTSQVFDAGQSVSWDQVNFTSNVPTGTSLTVKVRVGNMVNGVLVWTAWATVVSGGSLVDGSGNPLQGQYLQYSVTMTTDDSSKSPRLDDITFTWK